MRKYYLYNFNFIFLLSSKYLVIKTRYGLKVFQIYVLFFQMSSCPGLCSWCSNSRWCFHDPRSSDFWEFFCIICLYSWPLCIVENVWWKYSTSCWRYKCLNHTFILFSLFSLFFFLVFSAYDYYNCYLTLRTLLWILAVLSKLDKLILRDKMDLWSMLLIQVLIL